MIFLLNSIIISNILFAKKKKQKKNSEILIRVATQPGKPGKVRELENFNAGTIFMPILKPDF